MLYNDAIEQFEKNITDTIPNQELLGVTISSVHALKTTGQYQSEFERWVSLNQIDLEYNWTLSIWHDPDGNQIHEDPRDFWGAGSPTIHVTGGSYSSTLTDGRPTDRTAEAYLRYDEEFSNALEVTQRFENIFGTGRPVDLVTIQDQQEWLEILVIGADTLCFVQEFEHWWRNEFYGYTLTNEDTGVEEVDCGGFLIYDFDWQQIINFVKADHPEIKFEHLTIEEPF